MYGSQNILGVHTNILHMKCLSYDITNFTVACNIVKNVIYTDNLRFLENIFPQPAAIISERYLSYKQIIAQMKFTLVIFIFLLVGLF